MATNANIRKAKENSPEKENEKNVKKSEYVHKTILLYYLSIFSICFIKIQKIIINFHFTAFTIRCLSIKFVFKHYSFDNNSYSTIKHLPKIRQCNFQIEIFQMEDTGMKIALKSVGVAQGTFIILIYKFKTQLKIKCLALLNMAK